MQARLQFTKSYLNWIDGGYTKKYTTRALLWYLLSYNKTGKNTKFHFQTRSFTYLLTFMHTYLFTLCDDNFF